jgi:predicted CoA-substrate-specific enzyme activase
MKEIVSPLVAGVDVGSRTAKAVIMGEGRVLSSCLIPSVVNPPKAARHAIEEALKKIGLSSIDDIGYIVGTGYGRARISFASTQTSEITCHAKGAHYLCSDVRTVIDIGGQDCKVIGLGKDGKILDFAMNDKCAAGTGRFLESMARTLEMELEEFLDIHDSATSPIPITSVCSVFAESEVISLLNEGHAIKDIVAGLHAAMATRVSSLSRKVGVTEEVTITGGVRKRQGTR